MSRESKLRKLLVSLDINLCNALEVFTVNRSTISEIRKDLQSDIFEEFDRSSTIKDITLTG